MQAAHPNPTRLFDVKHDHGGMVDIEFSVQYLVLAHAHEHAALCRNAGNIALLQLAADLGLAIERRGSSVDDYTAPEGDGEMQEHLDVYQRTGLPCHRCGRPIRRILVGGRGTHFCSWCQRLPRGQRTPALERSCGRPGRRRGAAACGTNCRSARARSGARWTRTARRTRSA